MQCAVPTAAEASVSQTSHALSSTGLPMITTQILSLHLPWPHGGCDALIIRPLMQKGVIGKRGQLMCVLPGPWSPGFPGVCCLSLILGTSRFLTCTCNSPGLAMELTQSEDAPRGFCQVASSSMLHCPLSCDLCM